MPTKAEKEQTARNDEILRGTPGRNAKPPKTEEEIVAERDKVLRGSPKIKGSETAGNEPDMPAQ